MLEANPIGFGLHQVRKPRNISTAMPQCFTQRVDKRDAWNFRRVLHDEVHSCCSALPGRQGKNVSAVEGDASCGHGVAGSAHNYRRQCALTGAIRPHHRMNFT